MNAPTTAAAIAEPKVELIPLTAIKPSGTHVQELRRARFDRAKLEELAENIKTMGVLQAVLLRPMRPEGVKKYELVFGERRWLASQIAGVAHIPADIRILTDERVLEAQLIENLEREGLHELEEAEGYEELMKLKKINADAVADMLGKSRSYVYARTKLLALCPEARKAFYAGELDASRALLIARIGHHDTQRQALRDITKGRYHGDGPMSYREAHQHIVRQYMLKLKQAPFDIEDESLVPKAGSCVQCPKRTGNQQDLFGDVKDADVCTDPKCFDDKRQAHHSAARRKLEASGKKVIHGDAAKKAFPGWDAEHGSVEGRERLGNGYRSLNDETYATGRSRKVREVLGDQFEPLLIQHPVTGRIIEAATEAALSKVAGGDRRSQSYAAPRSAPKPKGPDVDEALLERLVKLMHEKAPKEFGRAQLQVLARRLVKTLNPRRNGLDAVAKAWGWSKSAFGGHYTRSLPSQVAKLDARNLALFIFEFVFVECYEMERKPILELFGIDEQKVREQIIDERKKASTAKRAADKAARDRKASKKKARIKAKPKQRAKKVPTFMQPLHPSPALAAIVGAAPLSRTDVTRKVWGYIKRKGLQDKKVRRFINADALLRPVFRGRKRVSMFDMTKLLTAQLSAKAPKGSPAKPGAKKAKKK